MVDLKDEARQATAMLEGKSVRQVWRHRVGELAVEFMDGTKLFVNASGDDVELSITGGLAER